MSILFKRIVFFPLIVITFSCKTTASQEKHDSVLFRKGLEIINNESKTLSDEIEAYIVLNDIKSWKYKGQIAGYLLLESAFLGQYEDGRDLWAYLEKQYPEKGSSFYKMLFPALFDVMEYVDRGDEDSFDTGVWRMLNNQLMKYKTESNESYLYDIVMVIELFEGEENMFVDSLNNYLSSNNFTKIPALFESHSDYRFRSEYIRQQTDPLRKAFLEYKRESGLCF